MKNLICSVVLSATLMGGIASTTVNLSTSAQPPKALHACWACTALNMGTWLLNVSWSEWRTWGYHPRYGPSYLEKHSQEPN